MPLSTSRMKASSAQLSQRPVTTSIELARAGDSARRARHAPRRPKFSAASGLEVVTTFQPARPPLIWSSEAKRRAT